MWWWASHGRGCGRVFCVAGWAQDVARCCVVPGGVLRLLEVADCAVEQVGGALLWWRHCAFARFGVVERRMKCEH